MNVFLFSKKYPQKKSSLILAIIFLCLLVIFPLSACKKPINYFDYVSELRNNIFLSKTEALSLRIYAVTKESPYSTDGIPREKFSRTEVYLTAPEGNKTVQITFQIGEQSFGGEMSYDMVKGEYYYACSVDVSSLNNLPCLIQYGEEEIELMANSVLTENTLAPNAALDKLQKENQDLFTALTDKYGFAGEIYLRLIYEGSPYYYIGVIDRQGNCHAFLMNAETGKILAKRQS